MILGGAVEAASCNALLSRLGKERDIRRMNELMAEMEEKMIRPNVITFGIIINHFCKARRIDDALGVLNKLRGKGENKKVGVEPDVVLYNNTVIDGLCKVGREEDGLSLLEEMKKMINEGLEPSVVTYGALIHAYCLEKNVDQAMKIYGEMCSTSKAPPDTVIYNILVDALCKNNHVEKAISLMDDMKVRGVRPNTTTYNAILNGVENKKMLQQAFELMDRMIEDACSPDYRTMEILTIGFLQLVK